MGAAACGRRGDTAERKIIGACHGQANRYRPARPRPRTWRRYRHDHQGLHRNRCRSCADRRSGKGACLLCSHPPALSRGHGHPRRCPSPQASLEGTRTRPLQGRIVRAAATVNTGDAAQRDPVPVLRRSGAGRRLRAVHLRAAVTRATSHNALARARKRPLGLGAAQCSASKRLAVFACATEPRGTAKPDYADAATVGARHRPRTDCRARAGGRLSPSIPRARP